MLSGYAPAAASKRTGKRSDSGRMLRNAHVVVLRWSLPDWQPPATHLSEGKPPTLPTPQLPTSPTHVTCLSDELADVVKEGLFDVRARHVHPGATTEQWQLHRTVQEFYWLFVQVLQLGACARQLCCTTHPVVYLS